MAHRPSTPGTSRVDATPALAPAAAAAHLDERLALFTDPADVHEDLAAGASGFVVVDARSPAAYARGHVPGAMNLWHRTLDDAATAALPRDVLVVTYCDGIGCNASTKAARKLAALGFRVKEMLGGLDWWRRDGLPVEEGPARGTP